MLFTLCILLILASGIFFIALSTTYSFFILFSKICMVILIFAFIIGLIYW